MTTLDQVTIYSPSGGLVMTADQAAILRADGYVQGNTTPLSKESVVALLQTHPQIAVCDFCSSQPVVWDYPARTYQDAIQHVVAGSIGGWCACAACYELIEAGDDAGLAQRAAELFQDGKTSPVLFRRVHDGFRSNRTGEPTKIELPDAPA